MNFKKMMIVGIISIGLSSAQAADKGVTPNPGVNMSTAPISAAMWVSPGRYTATIAPTLNIEMAGRLKKALAATPGLEATDASSTDSTVHFTIKEGVKMRVADLQQVIAKTDAGAVMTTPILDHSMTPKPGL